MRGRKPKPTELKILDGDQPCRINRFAPEPAKGTPRRPEWLDPLAVEGWEEIVGLVEPLGVLTVADGPALMVYACAYSRLRQAQTELLGGVIATTDRLSPKSHPAIAVAQGAEATMMKVLCEFGLTPASRSKVSSNKQETSDPLTAFMSR